MTSLTRRLLTGVTSALIVFWLIAAGIGALVMQDELGEIFDSSLQETAQRLLPLAMHDVDLARSNTGQQLAGHDDPEYLIYQVRSRDGRILLRSRDAPTIPFDAPLTPGFFNNDTHRFYTVSDPDNSVFVQVADAYDNRHEAIFEGAVALLLPIMFLVPLSIALVLLIVRRALKPVGELKNAIESKDHGDLEPIVSVDLPQELLPMARSINQLMTRLRAALDAEREFTSNSAHELRTPIAGALAQAQLLQQELHDSPQKRRADQIIEALRRLSQVAEKLLQLARAEAGIGPTGVSVDLVPVVDFIVQDIDRTSPGRIKFHRAPHVAIDGPYNSDGFAIALRNLVENAMLHGDPQSPITIALSEGPELSIINAAPTLSPQQHIKIRQRFSRGPTQAPGTGLGLSIAQRLLEHMKIDLSIQSGMIRETETFEVRLMFPPSPSTGV